MNLILRTVRPCVLAAFRGLRSLWLSNEEISKTGTKRRRIVIAITNKSAPAIFGSTAIGKI
jgi:hypothetical protein